jgi:hypothetical protein
VLLAKNKNINKKYIEIQRQELSKISQKITNDTK